MFPRQLWSHMRTAGLLGLGYPEEVGGTGGDLLSIAILSEELAKASGRIAITPLVSSYMAAPHLHFFGSQEQKERYLTPVLTAQKVAAIAVTEPGAGSDVASISLRATPERGGYRLQGTKLFITNGGLADVIIVAARTAGDGHRSITMFVVEAPTPGFNVGRPLRKMGWHSSDTRELIFDDCLVGEEQVLGELNQGFYQIMHAFQRERVVLAAMGIGLAETCLEAAVAYPRQRRVFGQPISEFQALRHSLAYMRTETEAARLLTYQAAVLTDSGVDARGATAMAKLFSAQVANDVVDPRGPGVRRCRVPGRVTGRHALPRCPRPAHRRRHGRDPVGDPRKENGAMTLDRIRSANEQAVLRATRTSSPTSCPFESA